MKRFSHILTLSITALLVVGMAGCIIPITQNTNYPLDVYYDNQTPERPYSEIQWLEISREEALRASQTADQKRMLERGNNVEVKNLITAQLVMKAQQIGADALVNVNYQYYTGRDYEGYSMRGLAVKYRGD
jgi:tRNA A37 N6-isopentenylltransferase MiaA